MAKSIASDMVVSWDDAPALEFFRRALAEDEAATVRWLENQSDLELVQLQTSFSALMGRCDTLRRVLLAYIWAERGVVAIPYATRTQGGPSDYDKLQELIRPRKDVDTSTEK